jgi:hypothetical protein
VSIPLLQIAKDVGSEGWRGKLAATGFRVADSATG